ncbi:MAG: polysaccharide deacetylase family protein [Candidatus Thorarchaeota archaeon]|nr:polysaccharide deacetylase family protein [Candidatus Thorarchaeota archaeon]
MLRIGYIKQLQKRWGRRAPKQMLRMMRLHRTPFQTILQNIFGALEDGDGRFAFPTIAAIARMRPDLVREIVNEGHEVASHGYNHVRYPTLSANDRERDFALSLQTYRKLGIEIKGFRAPYDNYTDDMPALLEKYKIVWDGGFGYRTEYREKTHFFNFNLNDRPSSVTYIPLNIWSDDLMIDVHGMSPEVISKTLKESITQASRTEGVIMFDLHPIRMGQPEFVGCLRDICVHANSLGAWCTTPSEAVNYWKAHKKWKGDSSFCLLLTGDIDNWVFSDYLRRVIWKRK